MNNGVNHETYPDWRALPDHILGTIFGYLCEKDRYNASLVCFSWSEGFSSPETWRRFTLDITRTRKYHQKKRNDKKCPQSTGSLSLNMLTVVAKHVRFLKVFCPWASDDRRGSEAVSRRLSNALGDLHYRGCQLHTLSLNKFDRMLTSWRDSRARLRVVKALKRFINSQRNLVVLDLSYCRFYPRELMMLLKAATYRSASTVTSINLKAAYCYLRFPGAEDYFNAHENIINNGMVHRGFILEDEEDQERFERNWPTHFGKLLSRFTCLKCLNLYLDVNVLKMDLFTNLPPSFRQLNFHVRRAELESEDFNNILYGSPFFDSNKWSTFIKKCPQLEIAFYNSDCLIISSKYC